MDEVIPRIIQNYFRLALNHGLSIEQQAQNTLLEIDKDFSPRRVVLRDFADCFIDNDIRQQNGLGLLPETVSFSRAAYGQDTYFGLHSFLYDFKLCNYVLEPIAKALATEIGQHTEKQLIEEIRRITLTLIKEDNLNEKFSAYFSPKDAMFAYPNTMDIWEGGKPNLIISGKPRYR